MMDVRRQGQNPSPWEKLNSFSRYIFCWTVPYFASGYKKELVESDLYDCPKADGSEHLGDKLEREWQKELQKQASKEKYRASLRLAVVRAFGAAYFVQSFFSLVEECVTHVLQPICLGWTIRYFSSPGSMTKFECYLSAAGVCFFAFAYVCTHHPLFFGLLRSGMKIRVAACTLIYKKSLKLSQRSMGKTTVGQMVNLLSNDVNRFDHAVVYLPFFIVGPVQTIVVLSVLWQHLGPSCLFGLIVLLLFIPFQTYMGKVFSKLRSHTAILTDERVRLMNEIVAGMRVIKMYTWEYPFAKLVDIARRKEIHRVRYTSILRGINIAVYFAASKVIVFVCFVAYLLIQDGELTAETVFVSMSLYNNLRLSMTFFFPMAISQWAESSISLSRIQKFLELGEQEESSTVNKVDLKVEPNQCGIWLNSVSAKWNEEAEEMTLSNLNMAIQPGQLWAVVGSVGSGKSSLLMTVLGELPTCKGEIKVRGRVAYSSQEPWVFAGTIQQNVLFGRPMDKYKYQRVLHVCALDRDIELLPYGDQSMVGERGVSLSGGQKARVNLARSIYSDGDVYLMDDPLSAVDVSVCKHLYDKCINGYIKKKARILVTHQVQFLKSAHKILILKHGKVLALGTYQELVGQGFDLMAFAEEEAARKTSESQKEDMTPLPTPDATSSVFEFPKSSIYESVTSLSSLGLAPDENEKMDAPTLDAEIRGEGSVKASTYFNYLRAGGGALVLSFVFLTNILAQLVYSYSDYWLSLWTNAEELKRRAKLAGNDSLTTEFPNWTTTDYPEPPSMRAFTWEDITGDFSDNYTNIYIYTGLMVGLFALSLVRTVAMFFVCMNSSVNLHNTMFRCVTRAPIAFFDKNPVGRILNRFTKDLGLIDDLLPFTCVDMATNFLTLVGIVAVVVYVSPFIAIPTVILIVIFVLLRRFYIRTARDIKRLEGTTRSPVFSHLSTSLYGITTIRSFMAQRQFEKDFCSFQDHHTSSWFTLLVIARWFAIMLDLLTVVYISCLTVFLLALNTDNTGGNIGLAISSALVLTGTFQWGVRQSAELESQMTAVERVLEYSKIKPEAELEAPPDKKPPPDWPKEGSITLKDFTLIYPDSGNVPVLKNLNCHIEGGEKVGIVGRTGAGKSSIIAALFRMTEPEGTLTIDGVKAGEIGLHDLRSKISIIPQDPILFTGPVRRNIDPFDEKSDEELWAVLEEVQLKETVQELSGGLDKQMSEGGGNFSVGQRQLVCLARALLRRNKILVLDEATANVDHRTDALIQNTIRDKFAQCTVLTIAHRLNTIMDSDKILVMDAGQIVEFDEPLTLLGRDTSQLTNMVKETGPIMAKQLYDIARDAKRLRDSKIANSRKDSPDSSRII